MEKLFVVPQSEKEEFSKKKHLRDAVFGAVLAGLSVGHETIQASDMITSDLESWQDDIAYLLEQQQNTGGEQLVFGTINHATSKAYWSSGVIRGNYSKVGAEGVLETISEAIPTNSEGKEFYCHLHTHPHRSDLLDSPPSIVGDFTLHYEAKQSSDVPVVGGVIVE